MNNNIRVFLGLAAGLALASPAALAAPRTVGGKSSTTSQPTIQNKLEQGTERNKSKPVGKGDTEFGFSLMYDNYNDTSTNMVLLTASIGKFLSDRSEFSIEPTILYEDSPGFTMFAFDPFFAYKYMFRGANLSNPVVPYVGAGIGIDLSTVDTGASTGSIFTYGLFVAPVAGIKAFVSERTSLEYALSYNFGVIDQCDSYNCFSGSTNGLNNQLRFNIYY